MQRYYKIWLFYILLLFIYTGCAYPYNTKQARKARKAQRIAKKQEKIAAQDSSKQIATIDTSASNIVIPQDSVPNNKIDTPPITPSTVDTVAILDTTNNKPNITIPKTDSIPQPLIDSITTTDSIPKPLLNNTTIDSIQIDSLPLLDSLIVDSIKSTQVDTGFQLIVMSPDSLNVPVQYNAKDSMIYDVLTRRVYLYGNAEVVFERYNLSAGHIIFDFASNLATATGIKDSTGKMTQLPIFDDKSQKFESRKIVFNFKSKKGKVYDASIAQGNGFLLSKATKFISGPEEDTTASSDVLYSQGCVYTSCDHKIPHFGIRTTKAKIIPNKLLVFGPSFLEIMGTPTPLVLPFGFFPITKDRRSGLIISTDIDFSPQWGPGIRGIGFHLGLSDYWDLSITGDFYVRGSYRIHLDTRYRKRYKYNGSLSVNFSNQKKDEKGTPDYELRRDFNIRWIHTQDQKAHPSQTFSTNINFGTASYFQNNSLNVNDILQSTLTSSVSYNKRFLGTPFSLSARMNVSQNTSNRKMTITLPQLDLRMNQIFPFKRKKAVGKAKWYERIGLSYNMSARNSGSTIDTVLFQPGGIQDFLDNMDYDIKHSPNLNMSFKVLKYINIQPSVRYTGYWYFYADNQYLDPTMEIDSVTNDTSFGTLITKRDYGFYTVHDFGASLNMNTQIFATGKFNIGPLNKIRGVFRPNVGFTWRPDYTSDNWGFYDSVQVDTRYYDEYTKYSRFRSHPTGGQQAALTFSISGRFDARVRRNKKDSLSKDPYKKVVLLNNVSLNGNYNFMADSLHLSTFNFSANTTLFKYIGVTFSAVFDPYVADIDNNVRLNTFEWTQNKRLARLTTANLRVSARLTPQIIESIFKGKKSNPKSKKTSKNKQAFKLLQSVSINYNLRIQQRYFEGVDSIMLTTNEISFSGGINLSKGWQIRVGRIGYDFSQQRLTFPDFTFSRDLHCWQMGLNWQPQRETWSFYIRVNPSSPLGFINIPQRKQPTNLF
ncbi:MAG: LPS-assembly protein LptD [Aureispira sp.]|nr:LPS-assembly protein LptD [Aureispira sp.]